MRTKKFNWRWIIVRLSFTVISLRKTRYQGHLMHFTYYFIPHLPRSSEKLIPSLILPPTTQNNMAPLGDALVTGDLWGKYKTHNDWIGLDWIGLVGTLKLVLLVSKEMFILSLKILDLFTSCADLDAGCIRRKNLIKLTRFPWFAKHLPTTCKINDKRRNKNTRSISPRDRQIFANPHIGGTALFHFYVIR